jgi:hypothetical protein
MAVKLIANYAKRLGLPGYSSHQFSISIETELQNLDNVGDESARLYDSLQEAVDQQIQKTGFIPPDGYGMEKDKNGTWNCSQKQRELIEKIGKENNLDQNALDRVANEMFGTSVHALNKLQASGLIDELLEQYGKKTQQYGRRWSGRSHTGTKGATA